MRLFHRLLLRSIHGLLLASLLGLTACSLFGGQSSPVPPDYLKITGQGQSAAPSKGAADQPAPVDQAGPPINIPPEKLEAQAMVPINAQLGDPGQCVLIARAEARRAALRTLGQNLGTLKDTKGQALSERLKVDADRAKALGDLLDHTAEVAYEEKNNTAVAWVKVPWSQVQPFVNGLPIKSLEKKNKKELAEPADSAQREAYDKAVENARGKLKDALLGVTLEDRRTVKDALGDNPRAMRKIDAMIFLAQPDDVNYGDAGSCTVTYYFDQNPLRALAAKPPRAGGHNWFGWAKAPAHWAAAPVRWLKTPWGWVRHSMGWLPWVGE